MRRLASLVAVLILLTATAAPVLACRAGDTMSREESACCRKMHGECGEMEKMGCCRAEVRTDESPRIASTSPVRDIEWVVVAKLGAQSTPARQAAPTLLKTPEDYLPPGLLTARITVLRI